MTQGPSYTLVTATHEIGDCSTLKAAFEWAKIVALEEDKEIAVLDPAGKEVAWARPDRAMIVAQGVLRRV